VEFLTRWPAAEAIPAKTAAASEAANFIYNQLVCRYGVPQSIQSDNVPQYANDAIENLAQILNFHHHFSTQYYPQANGRAERLIGTLKNMLVKSIKDTDREEDGTVNWTPALFSALYSTGLLLILPPELHLPC